MKVMLSRNRSLIIIIKKANLISKFLSPTSKWLDHDWGWVDYKSSKEGFGIIMLLLVFVTTVEQMRIGKFLDLVCEFV